MVINAIGESVTKLDTDMFGILHSFCNFKASTCKARKLCRGVYFMVELGSDWEGRDQSAMGQVFDMLCPFLSGLHPILGPVRDVD